MSDPANAPYAQLMKLLSRDPMLRGVLENAIPSANVTGPFSPDVDVVETSEAHVVLCDLPGVPKERVRVRLEGSRLVVEGERPAPVIEGGALRSEERAYGPFKREFLLPTDVSAEGVHAAMDDGVLTVTVPRTVKATGVDVPIGD